jgi:aminoglycoside phosphotransferase (APT) family kinase protein
MGVHDSREILDFLRDAGLTPPEDATCVPLTGGVSSDIWKVVWDGRALCVKRALSRLKVQALWTAPVERNQYEVAWMRTAGAIVPGCVPPVVAHDPRRGMFAMSYLDPEEYRLWKWALREGDAASDFAARVGATLVSIHSGTAHDPDVARAFATDHIFHDIRLDPYLLATGRAHPVLAAQLERIAGVTASARHALVHGDVSPKNIFIAPDGSPVFLDAECAWYGDPAFDLAFCLNHLLLKCLWVLRARSGFLSCFRSMARSYLDGVDWEPAAQLEARAAALLPGLFLARIDGKSPVEYVVEEAQRRLVRATAFPLIQQPVASLEEVVVAWERCIED